MIGKRISAKDMNLSETFYLTQDGALDILIENTDLCLDEIEAIVGRFRASHYAWPRRLKGQVVITPLGEIMIIHHFKKTILWKSGE